MISTKVHDELMSVRRVLRYLPVSPSTESGWTAHERQLFWMGLDCFPRGPWTAIAEFIGSKSTRQAMTHGQKLRQKLKRWTTRLHRNPAARSLMDGSVAVTPTSSVSVSTEISVSTARSFAKAPVTPSGQGLSSAMKKSPSPRPFTFQGGDTVRVVLDENLHQQNEEFTAKSCSDTVTTQIESNQASSHACGSSEYASATLQILFHPHAVTPSSTSTATPTGLGETKHNDDRIAPHPICEAAMPERNLLDELVDALWNDHVGERK